MIGAMWGTLTAISQSGAALIQLTPLNPRAGPHQRALASHSPRDSVQTFVWGSTF